MMLTALRLRELVTYDPETGVFVRRQNSRCGKAKAGELTGSRDRQSGYVEVRVDGKKYYAHRLAWLYVTGEWPTAQIDHLSGVRCDNRLVNLRAVTNSENQQNILQAKRHNRIGLLGVSPNKKRWKAEIRANGKRTHIGTYNTPQEAHAAYLRAKAQVHIPSGRHENR